MGLPSRDEVLATSTAWLYHQCNMGSARRRVLLVDAPLGILRDDSSRRGIHAVILAPCALVRWNCDRHPCGDADVV
jgi:hypothetical protein